MSVYLAAAAVLMTQCSSVAQMKAKAAGQDEGALAILILTVAAAMASLVASFAELAALDRASPQYGLYVTLAIGTVVLSWTSSTPSSPCTMPTSSTAPASTRTASAFPATASRIIGTSSTFRSLSA